jgi:WD40-like Beta Propeller Repeat
VINVDGTGLQRLTTSTGYANDEPAWSPDGRRITQAVASIQSPSWSPDGKQIAVNWAITKTDWEIFAIPVGNPGPAKNISDDVGAKVKGDDRYPDWAPATLTPDIEADGNCKPKDITVSGVGAKVRVTWTGPRPTRVKFGLHTLDADLGTHKAPYSATVVMHAAGMAKYECGIVQDSYIVRVPPISSPRIRTRSSGRRARRARAGSTTCSIERSATPSGRTGSAKRRPGASGSWWPAAVPGRTSSAR